jgi:ATP-dependent Zn protease
VGDHVNVQQRADALVMSPELERIAIHEAAHAVVGYVLGFKATKRGITIVPSANGKNVGMVSHFVGSKCRLPDEQKHLALLACEFSQLFKLV